MFNFVQFLAKSYANKFQNIINESKILIFKNYRVIQLKN